MTRSRSTSATLTKRYVTALLDAAGEKGVIKDIGPDAKSLLAMMASSPDLQKMLASPVTPVAQQAAALSAILAKARINPVLGNFVGVVIQNRRGAVLADFLQATLAELARRDGLMDAQVDVATPMNDIQQKKLSDSLSKWSGGKVALKVNVKPELLGGIKVRIGSIQIDDSISGKLERLRQNLLKTKASA